MPDNLFDGAEGCFMVLANNASELSLWPAGLPVPDGWREVFAENDRDACLHYVETHWRVTTTRSSDRTATSPMGE